MNWLLSSGRAAVLRWRSGVGRGVLRSWVSSSMLGWGRLVGGGMLDGYRSMDTDMLLGGDRLLGLSGLLNWNIARLHGSVICQRVRGMSWQTHTQRQRRC